ncbi:MAG: YeeE/YedE family protein [Gammaproteobacteria bacterium]
MSSNLTMAIAGGGLIGLSAVLLMLFNGRILGVSGIASNLISGLNYSRKYSAAFVLGVLVTATLGMEINPLLLPGPLNMSLPWMILAGMLVGFGTRLANGCTSGHGVCGVARFSKRSAAATIIFIFTAILTVYLASQITGTGI